jgi:hypothetical protein
VPSPHAGLASGLSGVDARSSAQAWAVGGSYPAKAVGKVLVLRWNGAAWTRS